MAKNGIQAKNVVRFDEDQAKEPFFENAEPVETAPLSMRKDRYLDETPQQPDWADDFEPLEETEDSEPGSISTFAEVFIPLHSDSIGTVIRKGMVIVSVIVILCCLVAILMKHGAVSAAVPFDLSAWSDALTGAGAMLCNP